MSIKQHRKKQDAISSLQGGQRIWAEDLGWEVYDPYTRTTTTFCPGGFKRFTCQTFEQAYTYLAGTQSGCMYEMLREGEECSLYFDCDLAFEVTDEEFATSANVKGWGIENKQPLTPTIARTLSQQFYEALKEHLRMAFTSEAVPNESLEDSMWTFSQACSSKKFSLHVGTFFRN